VSQIGELEVLLWGIAGPARGVQARVLAVRKLGSGWSPRRKTRGAPERLLEGDRRFTKRFVLKYLVGYTFSSCS
jgi:hypothetical protein